MTYIELHKSVMAQYYCYLVYLKFKYYSNQTQSIINFDEDTEFAFKDANAVRVSDIDAGDGTIEVRLSASSGTLFLANSINPNPTSTLTLTGSIVNINKSLEQLVYKPIKNFNGIVNIRVTTNDLGNTGDTNQSDDDIIYLNVKAVNDAPTFTKGLDDVVDEDSGLRRILWANTNNISKGDENEFEQTVSFIVTTSFEDSKLFESIKTPAIDPFGVLTYQPKPNAFGTANVSVILTK